MCITVWLIDCWFRFCAPSFHLKNRTSVDFSNFLFLSNVSSDFHDVDITLSSVFEMIGMPCSKIFACSL